MGNNFDLDEKIKEVISRDEELPESVKAKTTLAYEEIRTMAIHNKKPKRETNKKKWLVAASLLAIGVVGLQTPLLADIKELFFGGSYKGLTLQSNKFNNIEGDWLLDVTFPSEMTEIRETIYEVASPNDQIELTSAVAMKTGTKIDCIIKAPVDENVITAKIIGEDGTVFTTGRAGWMESTPNGERVVLTFEALEEDLGDSFTVQFPTLSGRDESITLTKVVQ